MIYLDNNASTPVDPEVSYEMYSALKMVFGNPSSNHAMGIRARSSIEKARSLTAELIGAAPEEIFFTSGGTESNNLAIIGIAERYRKGHIITSAIEHPSVINPCRHLEEKGFDLSYLKVDQYGMVSPDDVRDAIRKDTILITVMHANNETGVLQPIEEIGSISREKGIAFHTDAAQTVGKIPVNTQKLNTGMMTIVSHKFYGPKGVGALYIRKDIAISPILFGAGHERGLRPGTENVYGIVGIGKACELARTYISKRVSHSSKLAEMLYGSLKKKVHDLKLNGHETDRLPNTLNLCFPGMDSHELLERIKDRIAASSGSACHSGIKKPSPVLTAMGVTDADALSSIRFSAGKDNTEDEVKEAAEIIVNAAEGLRQ